MIRRDLAAGTPVRSRPPTPVDCGQMIVLGIDPGTASTGFGVIAAEGSTLRAIDHGLISTPARAHPSRRMGEIHSRVAALIEQHAPEAVAMEDLFVGVHPRAVLSVGQARGAVLAACGQAGLDAAAYPPAEVKAAVCGYGRADKLQVQRMVGAMLVDRPGRCQRPRHRRAGGGHLPRGAEPRAAASPAAAR